jgi:hypothetical protein
VTIRARLVLQDVRHAIAMHTDNLGGEEFRISWFAITGLLRAVGHVLANVDSRQSPEMASSIRRGWDELKATRPQPEIFWGFIESERNNFFKVYEHSVNRSFTLTCYDELGAPTNASTSFIVSRSHGMDTRNSGIEMQSVLDHGPFAGRNELDIAKTAVQWWQEYLDRIEVYARGSGDDF